MYQKLASWFNPNSKSIAASQYYSELLGSLYRMSLLVEARDPYTGGHLWRVSQYSRKLAEALQLPTQQVTRITLGAFLHDLGKISIPDQILNKKGRLTDDEYAIIKTHPEVGARLVSGHPLHALIEDVILLHHEMISGKGYPKGLKGEGIPLSARIVGIADAFDAMTSSRPYRPGMKVSEALDIIQKNLGTQFDEAFGTRFIELGKEGHWDHIALHSEPGVPLQSCPVCGPVIVIRRDLQAGEHIYCPACTNEIEISFSNKVVQLKPTGKLGTPSQLVPIIDRQLLIETIEDHLKLLDRP